MFISLDSREPLNLYQSMVRNPYFVDKSEMLAELIPLVYAGNRHVCITRPRRFGESVPQLGLFYRFGHGYSPG